LQLHCTRLMRRPSVTARSTLSTATTRWWLLQPTSTPPWRPRKGPKPDVGEGPLSKTDPKQTPFARHVAWLCAAGRSVQDARECGASVTDLTMHRIDFRNRRKPRTITCHAVVSTICRLCLHSKPVTVASGTGGYWDEHTGFRCAGQLPRWQAAGPDKGRPGREPHAESQPATGATITKAAFVSTTAEPGYPHGCPNGTKDANGKQALPDPIRMAALQA
jgi:hypothetical protein